METFTINQDGKDVEYSVLFTFYNQYLNKHFVVYTDQSEDEKGNLNLFVSSYDPTQEFSSLYPLSSPEEWQIATQAIEDFNDQVMDTIDYEENDSSIEMLPIPELKTFEINGQTYQILSEFKTLDNERNYLLFTSLPDAEDTEEVPVSIARILSFNEDGSIKALDLNLAQDELDSVQEVASSILESLNNE